MALSRWPWNSLALNFRIPYICIKCTFHSPHIRAYHATVEPASTADSNPSSWQGARPRTGTRIRVGTRAKNPANRYLRSSEARERSGGKRQIRKGTYPTSRYELRKSFEDSEEPRPRKEHWQIDKAAMKKKLGGAAWAPTRRKLSPDTMDGIRALNKSYPDQFTTPVLAKQFDVSPEAIRRILKSSWVPTPEEQAKRESRWNKRGESIWRRMAAQGVDPPRKWKDMGIFARKPGRRSAGKTILSRQNYDKANDDATHRRPRPSVVVPEM